MNGAGLASGFRNQGLRSLVQSYERTSYFHANDDDSPPPVVGSIARPFDPVGETWQIAAFLQSLRYRKAAKRREISAGSDGSGVSASWAKADLAPLAGQRVLVVVENLPVPFDRRVWLEARALKAAGADVSVICPKGHGHEGWREDIDGINIYRHPLPLEARGWLGFLLEYGAAIFWQVLLTCWIGLRRGIDVIHGCNPPDTTFAIAWVAKLWGVKYVFDHHDLSPELFHAKFGKQGVIWRILCALEKLTFRIADVSIATNDSYRRIAVERGGKRRDRVFVVRSGPNLSELQPVEPEERWKCGRRFLVGYVGVMGAQEGIDLLIDAVEHLVVDRGRRDVQFCLVGGGPELAFLRQLASDRGLADYITFTGRAPDRDLRAVLSTMDIGVNPDRVNSMNDKSTMNKIMEYMAFGKPIVQFDVTEGRVSAQQASLYAKHNDPVDLADKIEQLLSDPVLRQKMGLFGRERVKSKLAWEHQQGNLLDAYRALIADPAGGAGASNTTQRLSLRGGSTPRPGTS